MFSSRFSLCLDYYFMIKNNSFFQVAVACKSCPKCKYSFRVAYVPPPPASSKDDRSSKEEPPKEPNPDNRRRTERVKRVKPNFYDASEFETKPKKVIYISSFQLI